MSAKLECDAALSDLIMQAARAAIPKDVDSLISLPDCGERNQPLLPLLVGLLDAAQVVSAAVADNALDSAKPLPNGLAEDLTKQAIEITGNLVQAGQDHHWSPSIAA
jgi:hypothetical protein